MLVHVVIVLSVVLVTNSAPSQSLVSIQDRLKLSFKQIDADQNGIATLSEFQVQLKRFDANQDGNVTVVEYAAAVRGDLATMTPIFHAIDRNHNNSLDDFDLKFAFHAFDSNNNGEITQDEFVYAYGNFLNTIINPNQTSSPPTV